MGLYTVQRADITHSCVRGGLHFDSETRPKLFFRDNCEAILLIRSRKRTRKTAVSYLCNSMIYPTVILFWLSTEFGREMQNATLKRIGRIRKFIAEQKLAKYFNLVNYFFEVFIK